MNSKLTELGFTEIKPNLWQKEIGDTMIYHDYRAGKRKSYGYSNDGVVNVREFDEYKQVKLLEEGNKCKTLDNF